MILPFISTLFFGTLFPVGEDRDPLLESDFSFLHVFDSQSLRQQFTIFTKNPSLVFLDTAASSQKPSSVINALKDFYENDYSNIHRGAHFLGDRATEKYEQARKKAANFFGANSSREIIFTKNATESINLVARSLGDDPDFFQEGDKIILTTMEHHSNLIPWIQLAERKKLKLEYLDFDDEKNLIFDNLDTLLESPTKLIACSHVSNVLGTHNPVKEICKKAKGKGVLTLIDGCQAAPHVPVNLQEIDCDFYVASSHKMYGPSGIGILYGRLDLLKQIPPFLGGGEMIRDVFEDSFTTAEVPYKFEAGTPQIAEVVGFGAAIDFLNELGMENVEKYSQEIAQYAYTKMTEISEVQILSHKDAENLITFSIEGVQNYDISDYLSDQKICIRVGHHCAQILHRKIDARTSLRASFGVYTTKEDIDVFVENLKKGILELS